MFKFLISGFVMYLKIFSWNGLWFLMVMKVVKRFCKDNLLLKKELIVDLFKVFILWYDSSLLLKEFLIIGKVFGR